MDVNLVLLRKNGSQKSFSLSGSTTVIGRSHDCDLCIPIMLVSRKHCELSCEEEELRIRDLGSSNGTGLNGRQIDEAVVRAGDYVEVGPLTFALQIDGEPKEIVRPDFAAQKSAQPDIPTDELTEELTEETTKEDLGSFIELDDLDSFEKAG